jgi:hypothetical protein
MPDTFITVVESTVELTVDGAVTYDLEVGDTIPGPGGGGGLGLEEVQDVVGSMVDANTETGITVTYNDTTGKLNFEVLLEWIQDVVGGMVDTGNVEAGISVSYDDTAGKLNFAAEVTQTEFDAAIASVTAGTPSTEAVQDIVGAMVEGNTETNITVTYDDTTGKLNFAATGGSGTGATPEEIQDVVGLMVDGNTESGITVSYDDTAGKLNFSILIDAAANVPALRRLGTYNTAPVAGYAAPNDLFLSGGTSGSIPMLNVFGFMDRLQPGTAGKALFATGAGNGIGYEDTVRVVVHGAVSPGSRPPAKIVIYCGTANPGFTMDPYDIWIEG